MKQPTSDGLVEGMQALLDGAIAAGRGKILVTPRELRGLLTLIAYDAQKERIAALEKWLEDQVLKYRLNPDVATAYTETLARVRAHPRTLKIKGY